MPGKNFGTLPEDLSVRVATQDFNGKKALEAINEGVETGLDFIHQYAPNIVLGVAALKGFLQSLSS